MMRTAIVTGANGFLGSSLVRRLIDTGVHVIAVDRFFTQGRLPESEEILRIATDIDDALANKIPHGDYDVFYHLAWQGVNGPQKADPQIQLANVQMTVSAARACCELGVRRFLCAGTVAENAVLSLPRLTRVTGGMMYGVAKHCCRLTTEAFCKSIGLPFVWMQFGNAYGPGNLTGNLVGYTLDRIFSGEVASFGRARQPYDFIYIDDLLEAVLRLGFSEKADRFYYVGSGRPQALKDYLMRIGEVAQRRDLICLGGRPDDGISYSMEMFDTTDLLRDIGDFIRTEFDDGIRRTIAAWRAEHGAQV